MSCDCQQNCSGCQDCSTTYTVNPPTEDSLESNDCGKCDQTLRSTPVTSGSTASTNQSEVEEMTLLGRVGNTQTIFNTSLNGFIEIVSGVAKVVANFPTALTRFFHVVENNPATPPLDANSDVVTDASGNMFMIRGINGIDSIRYWDASQLLWRTVPLSELPESIKGVLPKSEQVEIQGFDASAEPSDTDVRSRVGLKGDGVVVNTTTQHSDGVSDPTASASVVPLPNDNTSTPYILQYSYTSGFQMAPLTVTNGVDGGTPVIGGNGNWFIDGVDTGVSAQGPAGVAGPTGPTAPTGATGPQGPAGQDGSNGIDGTDGQDASTTINADVVSVSVKDLLIGDLVSGTYLNPAVEAQLPIQQLKIESGWTHANNTSIFTPSSPDVALVEIRLSIYYVASHTDADITLTLRKGTTVVAEASSSNSNLSDDGRVIELEWVDHAPSNTTPYSISAIAETLSGGSTTDSLTVVRSNFMAISERKVNVLTDQTTIS